MKTSYTSAQLSKFNRILKQRGVDPQRFQAVLGSGILSDVFNSKANIKDRRRIRNALCLEALLSEPGSHIVDYDQDLYPMISNGKYDYVNEDIDPELFPIAGKGCVEFEHVTFHFGSVISAHTATRAILDADPKNPWEPAKIENLLAYGAQCVHEQRKYDIVGLGSAGEVRGEMRVPGLGSDDAERCLYLCLLTTQWDEDCRFLAVRKKVS